MKKETSAEYKQTETTTEEKKKTNNHTELIVWKENS